MKKKVLVTGGNGQLGKTIKELFDGNIFELDFMFVTKKQLDITKKVSLKTFFNNNRFDYCINCAAYTNVEKAEKTPEIAYKVNAMGVKNLAEISNKNDIILIHISTDYVFDGKKTTPYEVYDETNPINIYGKSKLQGEKFIQDIMTNYFIVRTSWLYSKKYGKNFYRSILENAKKSNILTITTEQKGCPTDTVNLAKFVIGLIRGNSQKFGISHFCDNKIMTWYDFAKTILRDNNMLSDINLVKNDNYCTFAKRPAWSVLKTE